ncbi:MAG TPA: GNAT family N-acetyltransferase, partial [Ktedonobacterales bacterium]|nr:GNAT family N-acetyltransferase [Ktedonobacterales bacterium]
MTEIRPLAEAELDAFLTVANDAYPDLALHTAEARAQVLERWRVQRDDRTIAYYGAFREGQLVGGMRHFDFTMNAFGAQVLTGGVGLVAVDLFHK